MTLDAEAPETLALALVTAREAARAAGAYLLAHQGTARIVRQKAPRDALLDADLAAEAIILERIQAAFPDHSILSEEDGTKKGNDTRHCWIVDPLDGSANYQHGSPLFGVAIASAVDDISEVGIIYLPAFNEMYSALRGRGATCNGSSLQVAMPSSLSQAIIHMGDFAKTGKHRDNTSRVTDISALADAAGRVRMVGSAATDFAYIASGRADGLVMHGEQIWDRAAGHLLATEAGAKIAIHEERGHFTYVCSALDIHHDLLKAVLSLKKRR